MLSECKDYAAILISMDAINTAALEGHLESIKCVLDARLIDGDFTQAVKPQRTMDILTSSAGFIVTIVRH